MKEAAGVSLLPGERAAGRGHGQAKLELPRERQREEEKEACQHDNEHWILQLKTPPSLAPGSANDEQDSDDHPERNQDPCRVHKTVQPHAAALLAGRIDQRKPLQEQHREDARHQVQDHAAQQRKANRAPDRNLAGGNAAHVGLGERWKLACRHRHGDIVNFRIRKPDQPVNGGRLHLRLGRARHTNLDSVRDRLRVLVGIVDDQVRVDGVELAVFLRPPGVQRDHPLFWAEQRGRRHAFRHRLRQVLDRLAERADQRPGRGAGGDFEVDAQVRLARNAGLAADQPRDVRVEMDGTAPSSSRSRKG